MKKLIVMFLLLALVTSMFFGCTTPPAEPAQDTPATQDTESTQDTVEDAGFTVGLAINAMDVYNTKYVELITQEIEKLGGEVILTNADNSVEKHIADVESLIVSEVDVILFQALNADASVPIVTTCNNAGIPVVAKDAPINTTDYDAFVGNAPAQAGEMLAQYVADNFIDPDSDEVYNMVSVVGFVDDKVRHDPFMQALEDLGYSDRINLLDLKGASYLMEEATKISEDWLQTYDDIDIFFAENDEMAVACINTLKANGQNPEDYVILGFNGDQIAQDALRANELDATVFYDLRIGAQICAQACQKLAQGVEIPDDKKNIDVVALGAMDIMDMSNLDELIQEPAPINLDDILAD